MPTGRCLIAMLSKKIIQSPMTDIRQKVRDGEVTARELATAALSKTNSSPASNTYLAIDEGDVAKQLSTSSPGAGESQLLRGIPISVKDCFDVRGYRTSIGSRYYLDASDTKPQDSAVVERLRAVGATITGKTHLNQLASGLTGENADYGNCLQFGRPNLLTGGAGSRAAGVRSGRSATG